MHGRSARRAGRCGAARRGGRDRPHAGRLCAARSLRPGGRGAALHQRAGAADRRRTDGGGQCRRRPGGVRGAPRLRPDRRARGGAGDRRRAPDRRGDGDRPRVHRPPGVRDAAHRRLRHRRRPEVRALGKGRPAEPPGRGQPHQHRHPGPGRRLREPAGRPDGPRHRVSGRRVQPGAGLRAVPGTRSGGHRRAGLRSHPRYLRHRRALRESASAPVLAVGALRARGVVLHLVRGGRAGHLLLLPRSDAGLRPERDSGDGPHRGR